MIIKADGVVIPGETAVEKTVRSLVIRNGTVEEFIPPSDTADKIIDLSGFVLSPFFCDYHLHFAPDSLAAGNQIADTLLHSGIRKVYEGGDSRVTGMEMKELLKDRLEVKTSGYALYKKGTYGKFIGKGVEGSRDAGEYIDELWQRGADYIKVINSGIFKAETAKVTSGGFQRRELAGIVAHARERGLAVFCHANGDKAVREAVEAGVSAIIHGLCVSDETLRMMSVRRVAFVPTVAAFAGLSGLTEDREAKANISTAVEGHLTAIKRAVDCGVRVLPGSDSGPHFIPYGKAYHDELSFFKKAGLSDEYIVGAAAHQGLAKGMKADFLVLRGTEISKVFIDGKCIKE